VRLLRLLKLLGLVLAVLVAVISFFLGGILLLGQSGWGSDHILRWSLPRVNAVLAGKIELRRLRFSGNRIVLDGLVLRDPEGAVVARIGHLAVSFSPIALLSRRLSLRAVEADEPVLLLREEEDGKSNLARAIASRQSRSSGTVAENGRSSGLSLELGTLDLRGGIVDLQDERAATPSRLRHMRIVDLRVHGTGRFGNRRDLDAKVDLQVRGSATDPLQVPVNLELKGHGVRVARNLDGAVDLEVSLGTSHAHLTGQIESTEQPSAMTSSPASAAPPFRIFVDLYRARMGPGLLALVAPAVHLQTAVEASGHVTFDGTTEAVAGQVNLAAAATSLSITASGNVNRGIIRGLSIHARHIDLGHLISQGPPSDIAFDFDAHGEGRSVSTLHGAATLRVPRGQLGSYGFGPLRLRVDADRGRFKVADLVAALPGGRITAAGEATQETLAFRAAIELHDLGAAVRSVTVGRPSEAPRAAGEGRIDLVAGGKLRAPWLHVKGRLAAFAWQDYRVPSLEVSADIANLRRPLASVVRLKAPELAIGARSYRGLALSLNAAGPRLNTHVSLAGPAAVRLDIGGAWNGNRTGIRLDRLTMALPGGTWTMAGSAHAGFDHHVLRIAGLDLRGEGGQRLRVSLKKTVHSLRSDLTVTALDLARLPASLLPSNVKTAGQLSAHVALDAARASGDLDLVALGAKASGHFDLPAAWPPPPSALLRADFSATGIDLQRVANQLRGARRALSAAEPLPLAKPATNLRGTGSFDVKLRGTGSKPELQVNAKVRQLELGQAALGDVAAHVDASGTRPTAVRIELHQGPGGQGAGTGLLVARTNFSLADFVHRPSPPVAAERLMSAPAEIEARIEQMALAPILGQPVVSEDHRRDSGTLSLELKLKGSATGALGKADLTVASLSTDRLPPTDAVMHVDIREHDIQVETDVHRRGAKLLSLKARLEAPFARLADRKALADARVAIHAELGPLELQRSGLQPESDRRPPRILKGRLTARADVSGTLRAPRLTFMAEGADIRLDDKLLGDATVVATYADGKASGNVNLASANGGWLKLAATTQASLGYPALARPFDWRRLAMTARLEAQGFDVSGLSGATPGLRKVAGQLFANVDVSGPVVGARMNGRLEWKDGGLTITGLGDYRRLHLLAHGDQDHVVLDELRADSGNGHARITASGNRRVGGGYGVTAAMDLDSFPAYVEGQDLAAVSLKARAQAEVSGEQVKIKASIGSARLALSDVDRKHLQKLARPSDVVLGENGVPLNTEQARKLAAISARLARADGKAGAAVAASPATTAKTARVVLVVDAPKNLWVRGNDANLELGLRPGFRVELGEGARVYGDVAILRGLVDVLGRRFDLKADSVIRFGGTVDAPELDVSANHVDEKNNITVLVVVKGSPGHLQLAVSAPDHPEVTETQLYTLIVTGRLDFAGATESSSPADQAASLVGGLFAAELQKTLSKKLPVDVLTIEASNGLGEAQLEAGKYLSSSLYVGYVGRLGADPALLQNRNAVHLEYELGSRWSFQGEYGDAKTGTADLIWTKRY